MKGQGGDHITSSGIFEVSGSVGIGTSSPNQTLHIDGSNTGINLTGGNNRIYFSGSRALEGNGTQIQIGEGHAKTFFQTSTAGTVMTVTGSSVGIGTSSPSAILDVRGASIYMNMSDTSDSRYINFGNWVAGRSQIEVGGGDFFIKTQSSNYLAFGTNASERMRITSGGNLLIGSTSDPGQKLYVAGDIRGGRLFSYSGGNASDPIIAPADDTNTGIFYPAADTFAITTGGTERAKVGSNGVFNMWYTFNANANGESFIIDTNPSNSGSRRVLTVQGGVFGASGDSSSKLIIFQANNGTEIGSVQRNGGAGVTYNTSSDRRLKEDYQDFNAISLVKDIKTYDFKWKDTYHRSYGVIADELKEIIPSIVSGEKDEKYEDGRDKYMSVDYGQLTPILIKAIQEQQATITSLQTRIEQLENK
jgi:hypothetical protein